MLHTGESGCPYPTERGVVTEHRSASSGYCLLDAFDTRVREGQIEMLVREIMGNNERIRHAVVHIPSLGVGRLGRVVCGEVPDGGKRKRGAGRPGSVPPG